MSGAEAVEGLVEVLASEPGCDDVDRDYLFARRLAGHLGQRAVSELTVVIKEFRAALQPSRPGVPAPVQAE